MSESSQTFSERLNQLLARSGLELVSPDAADSFAAYFALLLRWNARINLTAIRDEEGIVSRHFVESIACARALPAGIATLLDFGSGAGFPGIPIAICRPDIAVTLAESQGKKAAFLREAVRTLGLSTQVYSGRAESLNATFDCVTLRAVDRMPQATLAARRLVSPGGWLAVMTTTAQLEALHSAFGEAVLWQTPAPLQGGATRLLALAMVKMDSEL